MSVSEPKCVNPSTFIKINLDNIQQDTNVVEYNHAESCYNLIINGQAKKLYVEEQKEDLTSFILNLVATFDYRAQKILPMNDTTIYIDANDRPIIYENPESARPTRNYFFYSKFGEFRETKHKSGKSTNDFSVTRYISNDTIEFIQRSKGLRKHINCFSVQNKTNILQLTIRPNNNISSEMIKVVTDMDKIDGVLFSVEFISSPKNVLDFYPKIYVAAIIKLQQ